MFTHVDLMNYQVRLSMFSKAQKKIELVNKQGEYAVAVANFSTEQQGMISAQLMAIHAALEADEAIAQQYGYAHGGNVYTSPQAHAQSQLSHAHPQGLQIPQGPYQRVVSYNAQASSFSPQAAAFSPSAQTFTPQASAFASTPPTGPAADRLVGVKAATAAAAGKTINGVWYPPGKGPEKKGGGMGTPFATPAKKSPPGRQRPDSWITTDYELTGKWSTLPEQERTPPHILHLNRLAEKLDSELTPEERQVLQAARAGATGTGASGASPFAGNAAGGQGGLNYGNHGQVQQHAQQQSPHQPMQQPHQRPQQFNSFGAAVAGGMGASGNYQPQVVVQANDPAAFPALQEARQMGWMRYAPQ